MHSARALVAVDLGKTRCRAVIAEQGGRPGSVQRHDRRPLYDGVGAPGLAAAGGVQVALDAILPMVENLTGGVIGGIVVGAAGAWAAPTAASELAEHLAALLRVPVAVTSDVVSAHAGALDGAAGVLLIAGTGAAALGIGADSAGVRLVDGWGPELGDFGSGSWLGREALRAVLRASAHLGPDTALSETVRSVVGDASAVPGWLAQDGSLPRRLATLAPLVLDAAESGDPVAGGVADESIRLLTASAVAAAPDASTPDAGAPDAPAPQARTPVTPAVALHGGLTQHAWFRSRLESALRAAGRAVLPPAGDALDGALLLAESRDLPHERFVHRAE